MADWTPNQRRLITWLATPEPLRSPKTQRELAEQIGVRPETLSRWKRNEQLLDEVRAGVRLWLDADLAGIMHSLAEVAKGGYVPAIRLALEAAGMLATPGTGHQDQTVNVNVAPLSAEELALAEKRVSEWTNGKG